MRTKLGILFLGGLFALVAISQCASKKEQAAKDVIAENKVKEEQSTISLNYEKEQKAEQERLRLESLKSPEQKKAEAKAKVAAERIADAAEKQAAKERLAAELAGDVARRVAAGTLIREWFLDQGADIKVIVKGKNKDKLELRFVLFNDVWLHNFKKGDLCKTLGQIGFKEVYFNNGYDYNSGITWQ